MFHILMYFSAISRHLKQLGLVGEDSGMLRITLGVAILALGGIFAFRYGFLKKFNSTKESFLEKVESCDSNRICDNYGGQFIAKYPFKTSFSVDCLKDLKLVQRFMIKDKIFKKYSRKVY